MARRRTVAALLASMVLSLTGCGVTYSAQRVSETAGDIPVEVKAITPASLQTANALPYTPRQLPPEFYATAGAGGPVQGIGAVPEPPRQPDARAGASRLRPPPAVASGPYLIGVGDVIEMTTRAQAQNGEAADGAAVNGGARRGYTVRDDGAIAVPGIGPITVAGMTLERAENRVFNAFVEGGLDPNVSLEVAEFGSQRVSVGGAVRDGQLIPITMQPLSLSDALIRAGGVDVPDIEFTTIRIYRDETLYEIPMQDFLSRSALQQTVLTDGDLVFVDTTYDYDRALRFYTQEIEALSLSRSARASAVETLETEIGMRRDELEERRGNFSARLELGEVERDYVFLTGEVTEQGRVPLPFGQQAHLADVLYGAGGFGEAEGDPSQIYVLRADAAGGVTAWRLDARNAAAITLATRFEMRPDDVVFISAQPITTWSRALRQAFPILVDRGVAETR